eukprot:1386010-Amorphochlora_amoeboformis.AAC.1
MDNTLQYLDTGHPAGNGAALRDLLLGGCIRPPESACEQRDHIKDRNSTIYTESSLFDKVYVRFLPHFAVASPSRIPYPSSSRRERACGE